MVDETTNKQNSSMKHPTACDIVVEQLKKNRTDRENFLSLQTAGQYGKNTAVFTAVQKAFSKYGKGEGDVPIRHTDKGKIVAYIDNNNAEVPTNSCVMNGHYNVVQARKVEFISGIAEKLPYGEIQKKLVIEAQNIPEKLKTFITANHEPQSQKLPSSFKREYLNFKLSINDISIRSGGKAPAILPAGDLASLNCKAVTSIILRSAVREEENGKKTVVKQSELTEEIIAGAENFVYALILKSIEDEKKESEEKKE